MPRLIIEYPENVPLPIVLSRVAITILSETRSERRGIIHYCWAMLFKDGLQVLTRIKRKPNSADSLVVLVPEDYKPSYSAETIGEPECHQNTNSIKQSGKIANDAVYAEPGGEWCLPEASSPPKLYS